MVNLFSKGSFEFFFLENGMHRTSSSHPDFIISYWLLTDETGALTEVINIYILLLSLSSPLSLIA